MHVFIKQQFFCIAIFLIVIQLFILMVHLGYSIFGFWFLLQEYSSGEEHIAFNNLLFVLILLLITWILILIRERKKRIATIITLNNEIKAMNDQLKWKINKDKKFIQQKEESLKNYSHLNSHALREPLSKILGLIELIEKNRDLKLIQPLKLSAIQLDTVVQQINDTLNKKKDYHSQHYYTFKKIEKIIIVDDDRMQNIITEKTLLNYNPKFKITKFTNPSCAIQQLLNKSIHPDLIFLDINMPIIDGWEFLNELKRNELKIPVIMLTSSIDPEDKTRAFSFNTVKLFLSKPITAHRVNQIFRRQNFQNKA